MILKTIEALGPLHGYGIARRIEQTSGDQLSLNYGTLYPSLLKLEQEGWIVSEWGVSENNRKAKFYKLTRAGRKQLAKESERVESDDRNRRQVSDTDGGQGMRKLRAWLLRFRGLFHKDARERDFADEIESHLQMHIDDNIRAGMSPQEAQARGSNEVGWRRSSKRSLPRSRHDSVSRKRSAGSALHAKTASQEPSLHLYCHCDGSAWASAQAWRSLLLSMLRLSNHCPIRILRVSSLSRRQRQISRAPRSHIPTISTGRSSTEFSTRWMSMVKRGYVVSTSAGMEMVDGARVSDGFFRTLGVGPLLGRDFYRGEDLPEAPRTVILSYASWQKRFGGKQEIIGQPTDLE